MKSGEYRSVWLLLAGFCALAGVVLCLCAASAGRLPENVGRPLTAAEVEEIRSRNSPMTDYACLSPNADFPRAGEIGKITIHHMAGDLSLETVGELFSQRDRRASANYGIDSQGRVGLYVEEANRAWTSSSRENDGAAVTIEVANDETGGDWHVSGPAYEALLDLCTDVCRRNGIPALTYTGGPDGTLTVHKMFYAGTECPGPYLEARLEEIAAEVTRRLAEE